MTQVLLEEVNPLGNVQAVVEADDSVCHFYLIGDRNSDIGVKSVWVRNLKPAPQSLGVDDMRRGEPPMNPREFCKSPTAAPRPVGEDLRIIWLPEGNGAAVLEGNVILAIVPPWSGQNGFHGYARDCVGEGPLAWEMPRDQALVERFKLAGEFWDAWDSNSWGHIQEQLIESVEGTLGKHSNYYSIDGGDWPPRALLRIPSASWTALVSIGVCILPQPNIETNDAQQLRRIELGAIVPHNWSDSQVQRLARYLSAQARLPWQSFTWLGAGHTIPCDAWSSAKFTAALLLREHPALPTPVTLPRQFLDPVHLLWFVPITEAERKYAMACGSSALAATLSPARWQEA